MKNHFIFGYFGNKRMEVKEIYSQLDLTDVKYIIEPFCGSSAMSYYISTLHPGKYKYVLNDNDKHLMSLYKIMKDEEKYKTFINDANELIQKIKDEPTHEKQKIKYNEIVKQDNIISYFIKCKIYNIRPGVFPSANRKINLYLTQSPILNFLRTEQIEFYNMDAIEIINKYDKIKNSLFLIDPPYMFTCNAFYYGDSSLKNFNIYEYISDGNIKSKFYLIVEYIWLIRYVYTKDRFNLHIYDKIYNGAKKKKTQHVIVSNK